MNSFVLRAFEWVQVVRLQNPELELFRYLFFACERGGTPPLAEFVSTFVTESTPPIDLCPCQLSSVSDFYRFARFRRVAPVGP